MTRQRIKEISHEAAQLSLTFWGTLLTSWTSIATADELGLGQLTEILSTTDAFASLAEGHVGKTVAVLQAPIQQSCKTALDLMHAANIARLSRTLMCLFFPLIPSLSFPLVFLLYRGARG